MISVYTWRNKAIKAITVSKCKLIDLKKLRFLNIFNYI